MSEYGGNAGMLGMQLVLSGAAQQITLPPVAQCSEPVLQLAKLTITAPGHDVWVSTDTAVAASGAHGGLRIIANTTVYITASRPPMYVIGTNNDVLTYAWEWN